jgi:hypothetical protein
VCVVKSALCCCIVPRSVCRTTCLRFKQCLVQLYNDSEHWSLAVQTTPPCAEGLRWVVMSEMLPISTDTVDKMHLWLNDVKYSEGESNVLTDNRLTLPLNGRTVYYSGTAAPEAGQSQLAADTESSAARAELLNREGLWTPLALATLLLAVLAL